MPDNQQIVKLGLGEAVKRLVDVEFAYRTGIGEIPEDLLTERKLILDAMDHIRIEISFDCNGDGIPDTVEIFHKTAGTSCCRLQQYGGGNTAVPPKTASRTPVRGVGRPIESPGENPKPIKQATPVEVAEASKTTKKKLFGVF